MRISLFQHLYDPYIYNVTNHGNLTTISHTTTFHHHHHNATDIHPHNHQLPPHFVSEIVTEHIHNHDGLHI